MILQVHHVWFTAFVKSQLQSTDKDVTWRRGKDFEKNAASVNQNHAQPGSVAAWIRRTLSSSDDPTRTSAWSPPLTNWFFPCVAHDIRSMSRFKCPEYGWRKPSLTLRLNLFRDWMWSENSTTLPSNGGYGSLLDSELQWRFHHNWWLSRQNTHVEKSLRF